MAKEPPEHIIRVIRKEEIPVALDIWKETGMNQGTATLDTWLQIDPECYQVAVTPSGELLGMCSAAVCNDFGFVGLYAVREKYRDLGIGTKIWKVCYDHIEERNAGVNAVPGKHEVYRDRGGFPVEEPGWSGIMYETAQPVDPSRLISNVPGVEIVKVTDTEIPKIINYDAETVGFNREKELSLTLKEKDSVAFAALEDSAQQNLKGYGVLKMGVQGTGSVGPLYADNQEIAEVLLRNMVESLPGARGISMIATNANPGTEAITKKLGVPQGMKWTRLYKSAKITANLSKIYGLLDLNFTPF